MDRATAYLMLAERRLGSVQALGRAVKHEIWLRGQMAARIRELVIEVEVQALHDVERAGVCFLQQLRIRELEGELKRLETTAVGRLALADLRRAAETEKEVGQ